MGFQSTDLCKKATINQMIHSAYDIMEISLLICVNQMSIQWTVDCICTPRGRYQFLSLSASDQRGLSVTITRRVSFVSVSPPAELQTAVLRHLRL